MEADGATTATPGGVRPPRNLKEISDTEQSVPMETESEGVRLRTHIRMLGDLLGQTLARQEGDTLLEMVESVRLAVRSNPAVAATVLDSVDVATATTLARSFSIYFDLANVAEQVERAHDAQADRRVHSGPLHRVVDAAREANLDPVLVGQMASAMSVRPVFTAHPTEAARRSVLVKLRRIADVLLDQGLSDRERERRLAQVIDLLWQTDELRLEQPQVLDEAQPRDRDDRAQERDELRRHRRRRRHQHEHLPAQRDDDGQGQDADEGAAVDSLLEREPRLPRDEPADAGRSAVLG